MKEGMKDMKNNLMKLIKIIIGSSMLLGTSLLMTIDSKVSASTYQQANHFVADAGIKNYLKLEIETPTENGANNIQLRSLTTGWVYTIPSEKIWHNNLITHVWLEENWFSVGESYEFLAGATENGLAPLEKMPTFENGQFTNGNSYYSYDNAGKFAFAITSANLTNPGQQMIDTSKFVADAGVKNYIKIEYNLKQPLPSTNMKVTLKSKTTGWSVDVAQEKIWQNPKDQKNIHVWLEENWFAAGETYYFTFTYNNGAQIVPSGMSTQQSGKFTNGNSYDSVAEAGNFYFSVYKPQSITQSFTHEQLQKGGDTTTFKLKIKMAEAKAISDYKFNLISASNGGLKPFVINTTLTQTSATDPYVYMTISAANIIPEEKYKIEISEGTTRRLVKYTGVQQSITIGDKVIRVVSENGNMYIQTTRKHGMYAITATEQAAIKKYQDNGASVNKALRSGNAGTYQTQVNNIIAGIGKLTKAGYRNTKTVYRGAKGMSEATINQIYPAVGSYYVDKGFTSTSLNQNRAFSDFGGGEGKGNVHVTIINSYTGADLVQYLQTPLYPGLEEVLFKPNTKFKIVSKVKNAQGTLKVTMEEDKNEIFNYS